MSAETQRRAYLDAIGIEVWTRRSTAEPPPVADDNAATTTDWEQLRQLVADCKRCPLHESRTQTVFGVGSRNAQLMIIGEAPGAEEDRRGEPFVGRAGKLLDEMLRAIGFSRSDVFIANVLKCRPPNNRDPSAEEAGMCRRHLERQVELLQPMLVLAVGRIAAHHLLHTDAPLGQLRGRTHSLNDGKLPLIVTYHPAYLLRSPTQKRKAWEDLCTVRKLLTELTP
ncbi:MAG: uracil-DNA glycosylase [Gammaproteobacteria bacterium]|nr:uracil-DNA glycosylase [Gammaproteobacteria bacterium]MDH4314952.1 uracil-DNA glycosylase [Gammaproteobacteria bacterium]MDH5214167.1 uracil-DNA glycosylase [Gammaproteobacteria bacterium]MDH5499545.1 uracil-DNA glycosylase [Gammaproteobacteria bacterium]